MSKSHVSLEQGQCFICLETYDTGAVLLHKQLRPVLDRHTITTNAPCGSCKERLVDFVALIEADEKTKQRTGRYTWTKRETWSRHFNVPIPPKGVAFIVPGVIPS